MLPGLLCLIDNYTWVFENTDMYLNAVLWALHLHSYVCADVATKT